MDLRHLGAVGERLAVAGNAGLLGLDHHGIGEDHSHHLFAVTDGDSLPAFVSSELGEREPIRRSHGDTTGSRLLAPPGRWSSPTSDSIDTPIEVDYYEAAARCTSPTTAEGDNA